MNENWKQAPYPYILYEVSTKGRIRNAKTGHILNGSCLGGYHRVRLSRSERPPRSVMAHRLVARTYHGPPATEDLVVHHINHVRDDNRPENLRWITRSENAKFRKTPSRRKARPVLQYTLEGDFIKRWKSIKNTPFPRKNISSCCSGRSQSAYGYFWKYDDNSLEGEVWDKVSYNDIIWEVSSKGRVKLDSGHISWGSSLNTGYKRVCRKNPNGDKIGVQVHTLVILTFIGEPESDVMVVDHLDGDRSNNKVSNLEWVTQSENVSRARGDTPRKGAPTRAVRCISDTGSQIYPSISEAHRATGASKGNICMVCKGQRKSASGYRWEYVE